MAGWRINTFDPEEIAIDLTVNPLAVKNLQFSYHGARIRALNGVSLAVQSGEFIGIVGPTGAGKSTLCRCLNGLIPAIVRGEMSGEVRILGQSLVGRKVAEIAGTVGMIFQDFEAQLFSTSVELEAAFGLENFGVSRGEMIERVRGALETVGLTGFEKRPPSSLSGGEKQRLAIAAVLAMGPKILVMDEPMTDLDPVGKQGVSGLAKRLRRAIEAFVIVEHDTEHLIEADRILLMKEGQIVAEGKPEEVFRNVDLLEDAGVRLPVSVVLAKRLGVELPLKWTGAAEALIGDGWRVDQEQFASLQLEDGSKRDRYGEIVIEVKGLSSHYEEADRPAISGVSLTVRRGETIALLGKNGCGKTTFIKHLNKLMEPMHGSVRVFGRETREWSMREITPRVGYVFQNPDHQLFAETVFDEVAFGLRNAGVAEGEVTRRVREVLEEMGLTGYENRDPFLLTKGDRQIVAVASVLATGPEILILDEPTTGLDEWGRRAIVGFLKRFNAQGKTTIIVTHSMETAAECSDRCIVMKDGQILADRWTREIFADEEVLAEAALEPPEVTRVGNRLGGATLTVEELVACIHQPS